MALGSSPKPKFVALEHRRMDTRAQSIGLARFVLALIVGAVMIWIVQRIGGEILPGAKNATSNSQANQATVWMQDWIGWLPVGFLLLGLFSIIVYSVFIREAIGR